MCEKVRSLHGIFRSNRGAWPPDTGDVKGHDPELRVFVVDWARLYHIRVHLWFIRPDCPVTGCAFISAASPCPWIQSGTPRTGRRPAQSPAGVSRTWTDENRRPRFVKELPWIQTSLIQPQLKSRGRHIDL